MLNKPVKVVLIGNPQELSPELAKVLPEIFRDLEKMLNADHSALDQQYRKGVIGDTPCFDWYSAMRVK